MYLFISASLPLQSKAALEKQKQTLEAENVDMANEIKQLTSSKQESECKRKQAEQQNQELSVRLAEVEASKEEVDKKITKLQVWKECIGLYSKVCRIIIIFISGKTLF